VSIAGCEADIYDIYNEASHFRSQAKWLIRAVKNRPLINESGKRYTHKLWDTIRHKPITTRTMYKESIKSIEISKRSGTIRRT
jgi:hypothetical protein